MNKIPTFWCESAGLSRVIKDGVTVGQFPTEEAEKIFAENRCTSSGGLIPLYKDADGNVFTWHEAKPGAMCDGTWLHDHPQYVGNDGIALMVKLPNNHTWMVDSRANNCTMKEDTVHKCWVRHGDPRTGKVHVDKNGNTCGAGAGSILSGSYHGFLHDGFLVSC
jgi:hypothetical protein